MLLVLIVYKQPAANVPDIIAKAMSLVSVENTFSVLYDWHSVVDYKVCSLNLFFHL